MAEEPNITGPIRVDWPPPWLRDLAVPATGAGSPGAGQDGGAQDGVAQDGGFQGQGGDQGSGPVQDSTQDGGAQGAGQGGGPQDGGGQAEEAQAQSGGAQAQAGGAQAQGGKAQDGGQSLGGTPAKVSLPVAASPVFIDLETRSMCDLEAAGSRCYAADQSTQIMTAVALVERVLVIWAPLVSEPLPADEIWPAEFERPAGLQVRTFAGTALPLPLADAIAAGRPFAAHNAFGFDMLVWRGQCLPEPAAWLDTLPAARVAGLPGELDQLGKRFLGVGKATEGKALVRRLCRSDKTGKLPTATLDETITIVRYNVGDVLLLAHLYSQVGANAEPDVLAVDQAINARGVMLDQNLARKVIQLDELVVNEVGASVEKLTGGAIKAGDLGRTKFLLEWLRNQGVAIPNLQRGTVENALAGELSVAVRAVLEARLATARVTSSKLHAALAKVGPNGRLRDQFVYYGAHTGRWSGRGVQLQNLPRPHPAIKDIQPLINAAGDAEAFRKAVPTGVSISAAVSALVRPCLRAAPGMTLCVADFASVETRGLAWIAGEQRLLELFARGGDPYCDLASQLFGFKVTKAHERERQLGKRLILACGYGMSAKTFSGYCVRDDIDLGEVGITAEQAVEAYRGAYEAIAGYRRTDGFRSWREGGVWRDVETAALAAVVLGESLSVARCRFRKDGDALVITLPSGREIRYRNARVENRTPKFVQSSNLPAKPKPTLIFDSPEHPGATTYGGKLVENIVQAVCRDLLATGMVACERESLLVVLHCHDELVVEVAIDKAEEALRKVTIIMSTPPAWATRFPIEVEGYTAERYVKSPPRGAIKFKARNGETISQ